MLTKHKANLIRQLQEKKHRTQSGLFIVEGEKNIEELLNSDFIIEDFFATSTFYENHKSHIESLTCEYTIVEQPELEMLGTLESNNAALAVVRQKERSLPSSLDFIKKEVVLCLDDIRDPGNLGTIIRIADWYGIKTIIASSSTTDVYSNKVIAATMGSFTRVQVYYADLPSLFKDLTSQKESPIIIGSFLEGENIHSFSFPKTGILIMGNESHGINPELSPFITAKVTIPSKGQAESLNVAIATAVIIDNWKRL